MHKELKLAPGVPVTLRRDVGNYLVYYLEENKDRFPGVDVERVFVRRYPNGTLAAHILGSVGEVTEEDLEEPRYRGLEPGDSIGQDGVEDTYDHFLRGKPGRDPDPGRRLRPADAGGRLVSQRPVAGRQPEADDRRRRAGGGRSGAGRQRGLRGAFVTMDVHTRRNPRHGLVPDLRTRGLHAAADAEPGRTRLYRDPSPRR